MGFNSSTNKVIRFAISCLFIMIGLATQAQVAVSSNQTAGALAQKLTGQGVSVSNATLTCPTNANGIFVVTASNLGLDSRHRPNYRNSCYFRFNIWGERTSILFCQHKQ